MSEDKIKRCPKCGQKLRIPDNVGGILMVCPMCKEKIHSDFKIGTGKSVTVANKQQKNIFVQLFELPGLLMDKIVLFFSKR